ncbi:MAG: Druantia anti-phage system protein DruA, partial [Infirmifilum sp.]
LTYYWSFPVSEGVGRRLKILVVDEQNDKVMGIIGLKDPVIALTIRDRHIGWTVEEKNEYLIHVFDAHILGALPPYNTIFGGKLVASLLQSLELHDIISERYEFRHGFSIVLYTTTTVYGKSLMLTGTNWIYLGDTTGHSTFHLDYRKLRELLNGVEDAKKYKFGQGPNYPLRLARLASKKLGIDVTDVGTKRGFYILPLTSNYKAVLKGKERPLFDLLTPMQEISDYVKEKMVIPRAKRVKMKRPVRVSELMEEVRAYIDIKKIPL